MEDYLAVVAVVVTGRSLATCPKRPSLHLRTMYETSNRLVRCKTSSLDTKSCHLICRKRGRHRTWI